MVDYSRSTRGENSSTVKRQMEREMKLCVTDITASNTLAVAYHSLAFTFNWLGWRKSLRVGGLFHWAFDNTDGDYNDYNVDEDNNEYKVDGAKLLASSLKKDQWRQRKAYVRSLEREWCRINSAEFRQLMSAIDSRQQSLGNVQSSIYDRSTSTIDNDYLFIPPCSITSYALNLYAMLARYEQNLGEDGEKSYNYDTYLRTFDDTLIEQMLTLLWTCKIEHTSDPFPVYTSLSSADHVDDDQVLFCPQDDRRLVSYDKACIVLPLVSRHIDSQHRVQLLLTDKKEAAKRFELKRLNFHSDSIPGLADSRRRLYVLSDVLITTSASDKFDWWSMSSNELGSLMFSPFVHDRITRRTFLVANTMLASSDKSSVVKLLNDNVPLDTMSSILLHSLQVKMLTVYTIVYKILNDKQTVSSLNESKLKVKYFPYNSMERVNCLWDALHDLVGGGDSSSSIILNDVNRVRLHKIVNYRQQLPRQGQQVSTDEVALIVVPTTVLFDARIVDVLLEARDKCKLTPSNSRLENGVYLKHSVYKDVGIVLMPADVAPVSDRIVKLPRPVRCTTNNDRDPYTGVKYEQPDKPSSTCSFYVRLCVVFPFDSKHANIDEYSRYLTPEAIGSLTHDVIAYLYPEDVKAIVSAGRLRTNSCKSGEFSTVVCEQNIRLISSMLHIDPYLSRVYTNNSTDIASLTATPIGLSAFVDFTRQHVSYSCVEAKLWMILHASTVKSALVRSSSTPFAPEALVHGVSVRKRGLIPLAMSDNVTDTWKVYVYGAGIPANDNMSGCSSNVYTSLPSDTQLLPLKTISLGGGTSTAKRTSTATTLVPLIAIKTIHGRDWLIYDTVTVDQFARTMEGIGIDKDTVQAAPVVRLIGWYVDHFDPLDKNVPRISKISSKRVYMINGLLAFCEQPVKFVGNPDDTTKITKYKGPIMRGHFADYYLSMNTSIGVRFDKPIDNDTIDTNRIHLPPQHFYHMIFHRMVRYDRHPSNRISFVRISDYYVLSFGCARLWFPTVSLLRKLSEDPLICYANVPRQIIPLVDYYVRQAANVS